MIGALRDRRVLSLTLAILVIQYLSFYCNIDGAAASVMSAIVVAQSFIGDQYLKVRNRLLGTLTGGGCALVAVLLFPENEVGFIAITLVWMLFITTLTHLVNSEHTYLLQLMANTWAFVAIPILADPTKSFHTLLFRATDVTLGAVVLLLIASLLFPRRIAFNLEQNIRAMLQQSLRLRRKVVAAQSIETSELKAYFATISQNISHKTAVKYELGLSRKNAAALDIYAALTLKLFFYANALRHVTAAGGALSSTIRNEFTAIIEQAIACRRDLRKFPHPTPGRHRSLPEHRSFSQAGWRGLRALLLTAILLAVWYFTGWAAGATMTTLGMVYITLLGNFPAPIIGAKESLYGTALGIVAAWGYLQLIYGLPYIWHFPAGYFLLQIPLLIYGGGLLFNLKSSLLGITFLTTFFFAVAPNNSEPVAYSVFINNALGALAGLLIGGIGLVLIFPEKTPPDNRHLIRRSLRELSRTLISPGKSLTALVNSQHDRLRLSASLPSFTRDDFTVLANLTSLSIIVYHLSLSRQHDELAAALRRLLQQWQSKVELKIDEQTRQAFTQLILREPGEISGIACCTWDLLKEIEHLYES